METKYELCYINNHALGHQLVYLDLETTNSRKARRLAREQALILKLNPSVEIVGLVIDRVDLKKR